VAQLPEDLEVRLDNPMAEERRLGSQRRVVAPPLGLAQIQPEGPVVKRPMVIKVFRHGREEAEARQLMEDKPAMEARLATEDRQVTAEVATKLPTEE
jgi:hypothetical protein